MNYLIDTCVISEFTRARPQTIVLQWLDSVSESSLFLSVITFGELHKGISRLSQGAKHKGLSHWVEQDLKKRFEGRILNLDLAVMETWGNIMGELEKKGRLVPLMDSLIAATALEHDLTIATRNTQDMQPLNVRVINPWGD